MSMRPWIIPVPVVKGLYRSAQFRKARTAPSDFDLIAINTHERTIPIRTDTQHTHFNS